MGFLKQLLNRYLSGGHQSMSGHGNKRGMGGKHGNRYGYSEPTYNRYENSMGNTSGKICQKCNTNNLDTAKFCQQCGTSIFSSSCTQCGVTLLPDAKFCPQCGKSRN